MRPVLTLSTKRLKTDHAPEGELTAEALRNPNSELSKTLRQLGKISEPSKIFRLFDELTAANGGLMSEMFRSHDCLIEALSSSLERLSSSAVLMEALPAPLPGFSPEFRAIAADCIGPDGELDLERFEIRAQVRLNLSPNELRRMSARKIVAYFQERARYDDERDQRVEKRIVARLRTDSLPAILNHQQETLGARIRHFRRKEGLTQYALARLVRVAESTVKRWEGCKATPTPKNTRRICKALKIPVETQLDRRNAP